MQLELFGWEPLSEAEKEACFGEIRRGYWFVRYARRAYNQAAKRRYYRQIAKHKKRLLMAGVPKREILDFLAKCRAGRTEG